MLQVTEARRPPRPGLCHLGQALGEDPTGAALHRAPEASGADPHLDPAALPGQVGQAADVVAVDPSRPTIAGRTSGLSGPWLGHDDDAVGLGQHLRHGQACRDQGQEATGHFISGAMGVSPGCAHVPPPPPPPAPNLRKSPKPGQISVAINILGHLPLEGDAVGTVPCHDFHPPEAQAGGSIHFAQTVHREGRTPIAGLLSTVRALLINRAAPPRSRKSRRAL